MKHPFKKRFDYVRIELHGFRLVKVRYVGTKSSHKFGWHKKPKVDPVQETMPGVLEMTK
jgi:hypothetical protein